MDTHDCVLPSKAIIKFVIQVLLHLADKYALQADSTQLYIAAFEFCHQTVHRHLHIAAGAPCINVPACFYALSSALLPPIQLWSVT